jgi:hypothetical protein
MFKTEVDSALHPVIEPTALAWPEIDGLEEKEEEMGILQFLNRLEEVTQAFFDKLVIQSRD